MRHVARALGRVPGALRRAPMPAVVRRAARASIWAPGAIPPLERKYAVPLKRFVLPLYDVLLLTGGLVAIVSGIPSLDRLLPHLVADALAVLLAVSAFVALLGVSFPALWRAESYAKVLIVGLLGTYFIALVLVGGESRQFIAIIVLMAIITPCARLWILGSERRVRLTEGTT